MKELTVGIIGCGNIFTMHATSAHHLSGARMVAVCDIKPERAEAAAKKYRVRAYTDYQKMIEEAHPDIVHICLPHYLHAPVSRWALEHGVHVLCEKPMAIRMEDALANVQLAKKNNLRYGIIFQSRFNDASVLVKRYLDNGDLGRVISARVVLTWSKPDSYYLQSDWKGTWEKEGGGVIIDQAIHSLDLANWFIGDEPVSVRATLLNRGHKIMEVDDTGEGLIRYKNGAVLCFYAMNNYGCDDDIEIRLYCEKGKARLSYTQACIELEDGRVICTRQKADTLVYEGGKDYWGFQHVKQISDFYDSVRLGSEPAISGEEALKIQKIICEIYKQPFYPNTERENL